MAIKILTRQIIYPKNGIYEAVYLLSAKMHLNNLHKFKKIPIGVSHYSLKQVRSKTETCAFITQPVRNHRPV